MMFSNVQRTHKYFNRNVILRLGSIHVDEKKEPCQETYRRALLLSVLQLAPPGNLVGTYLPRYICLYLIRPDKFCQTIWESQNSYCLGYWFHVRGPLSLILNA